eukprot:486986-Alexandrium_andersonii.AAC.1
MASALTTLMASLASPAAREHPRSSARREGLPETVASHTKERSLDVARLGRALPQRRHSEGADCG